MRTDQEIFEQTNKLARRFYSIIGKEVEEDYRFDLADHPEEKLMWEFACEAQLELTDTDINDVLLEIQDDGN